MLTAVAKAALRSPENGPLRTTAAALVVALLMATAGLALPATTVAASTAKVVVIVGPTGSVTSTYRSEADAFASEALKYTPNVVKVYSPNATWAAVSAAMQGASVVVYLGHGTGFPSPYSTTLNTSTEDGFGLNATANSGDSNTSYYGESYIRTYIHLAPNAVVIFNHACYATGSSEPGYANPTLSIAEQRIDNYAAGFQAAGAAAVFATNYNYAYQYIDYLFGTNQTLDSMWRHAFDAQGHFGTFASTRTPGTTDEYDPTISGSSTLYYRALSGKISTMTSSVVTTVADTTAPTVVAPVSRLYATGTIGTTTPVRTYWSGSDAGGISSYYLQRQTNGGTWSTVTLPTATTTSIVQSLALGSTYRFGARAKDSAGNLSAWVYGATFKPTATDQTSGAVKVVSGSWSTQAITGTYGGSVIYTKTSGSSSSFTFTGYGVSWIAYRGPDRGSAQIYLDGVYYATVSTYASTYTTKVVAYAANWGANGTHTIKVVNLATSGHPRIDVDAFVSLVSL
jgi:hypothetical protein